MNARAHHSACGRRLLVREDGSQLVRRQQVGACQCQQLLMLRLHLRMVLLLLVLVLVLVLVPLVHLHLLHLHLLLHLLLLHLLLLHLLLVASVLLLLRASEVLVQMGNQGATAPIAAPAPVILRRILRIHAARRHAENSQPRRCAETYSYGKSGQRLQRVHGVGRCEARRRVAVPAGGALRLRTTFDQMGFWPGSGFGQAKLARNTARSVLYTPEGGV